jgi:hypothetical protein
MSAVFVGASSAHEAGMLAPLRAQHRDADSAGGNQHSNQKVRNPKTHWVLRTRSILSIFDGYAWPQLG